MKILKFYITFSSVYLLGLLIVSYHGSDEWVMWNCLMNFYILFFFSLRRPIKIFKSTFFKIDVFFLSFYYLIFYSMYQGYLLGFNLLDSIWLRGYEDYVNISLIISSLALNAFSLGVNGGKRFQNTSHSKLKPANMVAYKSFALALFIIEICLIYLYSKLGLAAMLSGKYMPTNVTESEGTGVYFLITVMTMLSSSVVLYFYFHFRKFTWHFYFLFFVIIVWTLILLMIGDRNSLLLIILIFMGGYYSLFKTISPKKILMYFYASLMFYQLVEIYRSADDRSISGLVEVVGSKFNGERSKGDKDFFSEDNSFFTTTVGYRGTFSLVPNKIEHTLGYYQSIGVIGVIPFIKGYFLKKGDMATTSNLLTLHLKGRNSPMGIGTNVISDLYIDFGFVGVLIGMFILGRYILYIEEKIKNNMHSVLWFSLYFISLATISEMPRYNFTFPLRTYIWVIIVISTFSFLNGSKLKFKPNVYDDEK